MPKGGVHLSFDPLRNAETPLWTKLWRDFTWSILRAIPAQRKPFERRAGGRDNEAMAEVQNALSAMQEPTNGTDLPSTYCIGAQAETAEAVPMRDVADQRLLLEFWPVVASIFCPRIVDYQSATYDFWGFAVAVPDVAHLSDFVELHEDALRARSGEATGYRPKEAVIEVPQEAGLMAAVRIRQRISAKQAKQDTSDVVLGYDVFHVEKDDKQPRLLWAGRIDCERGRERDYEKIAAFSDALFRRQRVLNLLRNARWYAGFDDLLTRAPYKPVDGGRTIGFGAPSFRKDVRTMFDTHQKEQTMTSDTTHSLEAAIYRIVQSYVRQRLETKYGLRWEDVKDSPRKHEYNEAKEKIARDAFLAVRSRRDADFLEYFAGTFGSVAHHMNPEDFVAFARALRQNPADARTLTLLALSAVA